MVNCAILFLMLCALSIFTIDKAKCKSIGGRPCFLSFEVTDCCKGVAILLIMLSHVSGTMGTVLLTPLGGTGVAMFLFLSGYGLNESYKKHGLTSYWRKKIKRVFVPYAIVITLLCVYHGKFDFLAYVLNITGLKTSYWYIGFLMKWYIIYYLFTRFAKKYRMMLMLICAISILFLFPNIEAEQAFSFLCGVCVSVHIDYLRTISMRKIVAVGGIALLIGISFLAVKQLPFVRLHTGDWIYNVVQFGIKLPLGIAGMIGVTWMSWLSASRFLQLAGALSYELYLVHFPFYGEVHGMLLLAILLFVGSFGIAYLFQRLNKRVTIQQ